MEVGDPLDPLHELVLSHCALGPVADPAAGNHVVEVVADRGVYPVDAGRPEVLPPAELTEPGLWNVAAVAAVLGGEPHELSGREIELVASILRGAAVAAHHLSSGGRHGMPFGGVGSTGVGRMLHTLHHTGV